MEVIYENLIYEIAKELEGKTDLNWVRHICGSHYVRSVLSCFQSYQHEGKLGIDNLENLKEILRLLDRIDLLERVQAFENERRQQLERSEVRANVRAYRYIPVAAAAAADDDDDADAAAAAADDDADAARIPAGSASPRGIISTVARASRTLTGVVDLKCVYRLAGAGVLLGATHYILKHCRENPGLIGAFTSCAMPAGVKLIELGKGCICLTVQVETLRALKALLETCKNGSLQMSLEEHLVTDEIKEMAKGKDVELTVTIDQSSYQNACLDLLLVENRARAKLRGINACPRKRTMSDSALVVKSDGDIVTQQHSRLSVAAEEKRRELSEEELQKYLLAEKYLPHKPSKVSEYLENLELGSVSAESGFKTESLSDVLSERGTEEGDQRYNLMWLDKTTALVCHGCGGKLRPDSSGIPVAPFDVVVTTNEYRRWRDQNSGITRITKEPEPTHYHMNPVCLLMKNRDFQASLIQISAEDEERMLDTHKQLLKQNLGITIRD